MAGLSNYSKLETSSFLWLDTQVNILDEYFKVRRELRQIIHYLRTFDDPDQCLRYILHSSPYDHFVLLIRGNLAEQIVPKIHGLRQISAIYIYSQNKQLYLTWAKHYNKIQRVATRLENLITRIRSDQMYRRQVEETLPIDIYTNTSTSGQSTTELDGGFVHSLLLIDVLLRMKFDRESQQQFIEYCYDQYKNNSEDLSTLEEFKQTYSSADALSWYARNSFIYQMLNKALRQQDIQLLFLLRFLIRDIYEQLKQNQCSSPIRVYRGQAISNDELLRLQGSIGNLISINSFFSTSRSFDKAIDFLKAAITSNNGIPVLFIIDADPRVATTKPFSDITAHSHFEEQEVLFMIGCVFRLRSAELQNGIWMIHMQLCDDHDKHDLFQFLKKDYAGNDKPADLKSFGTVLHKMGRYDLAQMAFYGALNKLSTGDPGFTSIYRSLGMIFEDKGEYDVSLKWYRAAWEFQMHHNPSDYFRIAHIYCCIGVVYKKKDDLEKALEYYYKAIDLFEKNHNENHRNMASFYNNIAIIYSAQHKYRKALDFYKKVLAIERRYLPADHSDLAMTHHNIGSVYLSKGDYELALSYYHESLEIKLKSLPSNHPLIAKSYVNIGRTYEATNDLQQALMYFEKAADIRRRALSSDHPDLIRIEEDIRRLRSQRR